MFVNLKDISGYMFRITDNAFLDLETYQIIEDENIESNCIFIPKSDDKEIIIKYAEQLNDKRLKIKILKKKLDNNLGDYFHTLINNNGLYLDWISFREDTLLLYAKEWCENNNIIYTNKSKK